MVQNATRALAEMTLRPYWTDDPAAPEPAPALVSDVDCDLAVVGGGYSGLWAALLAKEADPSVDVVLLEARTSGWAASGRNGGFCSASLTHGLANGRDRFPSEIGTLERLGRENLDAIEQAVASYDIDCNFERTGELSVAVQPHQLAALIVQATAEREYGHDVALLDIDQVRAEVDSPTYLGGLWDRRGCALVHPAKLAWGLRAACLRRGVRIYEQTPVLALDADRDRVVLDTPYGRVRARRAALGTNAFHPLLRRIRLYVAPVYDYALMTEPLSAAQLTTVGWQHRQGVGDSANQFHYYRLTTDNRILWGGYDAVYHYRNGMRDELDVRPETFARLADHFFATFPQLAGLRFTHGWGGAVDTCSRFCAFFGTALHGRVAYAAGYTGLGVGATRFGAQVMLDLLAGRQTELTALRMVRSRPLPFPPEPLRYAGIQLTRHSLGRADRRDGRRDLWLRALDRIGMGFDS